MRPTQTIPLDKIIVSDRLRAVDPDKAMLIAASMADEGLNTPIEVRPVKKKPGFFQLIVGGHRVAGAKALEWDTIEAVVLDISADEARMREIDENLYRAELTALDRAVFLAEKKRLYEKLHPETRHGGDRKSEQVAIFGDLAPRFSAEACDRLGMSERTLQRVLKRASLPADVRARIARTPLADSGADLDALLKLAPEQRMAALDLIFSGDDAAPANVGAAVTVLSGARPQKVSDADALFDKFLALWKQMPAAAKARVVDFLAEEEA